LNPLKNLKNTACELKKRYGLTDKDFVFVFIGRLVKDKGIEELLKRSAG